MSMEAIITVLAAIVAITLFIFIAPHFPNKNLNLLKAAAKQQFLAYQSTSNDPCFQFDGSTAKVIKTKEDIARSQQIILSYSLTFYAKNHAGEYFIFVSNESGAPFFKHIEHAKAKIILGKKYIA